MKKLGLVTPPKPNSWIPKNDAMVEAGDNKTPKSTITGSFMTTIFWWVFETLSDWLHPKPSFGGLEKIKRKKRRPGTRTVEFSIKLFVFRRSWND